MDGALPEERSTRNLVKTLHVETGTKETCGRASPFSVLLPIRTVTNTEDEEVTSTGPVCFHVQSNHALWKQQMAVSFSRFTLY